MAEVGLLEWANSVRFTMANDPGRQFFQDQIHTHGFIFLDDYFNNILAGAKRDPLIELVKTPGRKKAIAGRGKPSTATPRTKNVVTLMLEDAEEFKENVQPLNNFHKALLGAKEKNDSATHGASNHQPNGKMSQHSSDRQEKTQAPTPAGQFIVPEIRAEQTITRVTSSQVRAPIPEVQERHQERLTSLDAEINIPMDSNRGELSVITEDDESAEPNRVSVHTSRQDLATSISEHSVPHSLSLNIKEADSFPATGGEAETKDRGHDKNTAVSTIDILQVIDSTMTSSTDTHHPLYIPSPDSPKHDLKIHKDLISAPGMHQPSQSRLPAIHEAITSNSTRSSSHSNVATIPEPTSLHLRSAHQDDAPIAAVPLTISDLTPTSQDFEIPLKDTTPNSPKDLTHKLSVPLFPSLPAPMPLRKSTRAPRDPSIGAAPTVIGAATPGTAMGGKRTSWLMKAREIKAMEVPMGKTTTLSGAGSSIPMPGLANGTKRKSAGMFAAPSTSVDEDERKHKAAKVTDDDVAPLEHKSHESAKAKDGEVNHVLQWQFVSNQPQHGAEQEGMLDRFKRTVEGLGARVGKSMGKSLGGAATNALADARAAAEARIAERNNQEERTVVMENVAVSSVPVIAEDTLVLASTSKEQTIAVPASRASWSRPPKPAERKLSVSDLATVHESNSKDQDREPNRVVEPVLSISLAETHLSGTKGINVGPTIASATPLHSPPSVHPTSLGLPFGPMFNKPPPVFIPPAPMPPIPINEAVNAPRNARNFSFDLSAPTLPSVPSSSAPALAPPLHSSSYHKGPAPLSAQSTLESVMSDALFDSQDVPAWMPATQDTEYSSAFGSQPQSQPHPHGNNYDEDDSWPMNERLSGTVPWTFHTKDDSLTWSTAPNESPIVDTQLTHQEQGVREMEIHQRDPVIPGTFDISVDENEGILVDDREFDEIDIGPVQPTIGPVESNVSRSQSQLSIASSVSSQSQGGFLGHASKLVSSVLGAGKKGKLEVKSLQLAAVAAKKHQEDKDKKVARLKEMENRRQLALQRKAEDEKAKALEEGRKIKEDGERRKREREEHTDKRPLKGIGRKEDDNAKKRKVAPDTEKKPAVKSSQPNLNLPAKPAVKHALKQPATTSSSVSHNVTLQTATISTSTANTTTGPSKTSSAAAKGKNKLALNKAPTSDDEPSRILQTQMAARAKAQLQAAKQLQAGEPASESIELPDINSEYSDSDDEDRPRTFDPPDWAQSPELGQALQLQSRINPDDIFGIIRPLKMEELFRTKASRFRARTSSANWTGTDQLTIEEQREYAKRMGYR